jgi:tetratricopeptide (TPR) repeat protein
MLRNVLRKVGPRTFTAVLALTVAAALLVGMHAWRTPPGADFRMIGPRGGNIVVQLPQLTKIPPLDHAAACARVQAHNARARGLKRSAPDDNDDDSARVVHHAAEAGCARSGERNYPFYDELGDVLNAGSSASRFDADQMLAAMREALRTASSADDVDTTLKGLNTRATYLAEPLHAPDFFLIGAEVMAVQAMFCTGKDAPACRAEAHSERGRALYGAGRWRADADLLRASIAAYRDALRDVDAKSRKWVEFHTLIGSSLGQLSEEVDGEARAGLLRQALDEYGQAATAVDPAAEWTWALINQNVCSIRQPLAAIEMDRAGTKRAIEECEKARDYYQARGQKTNEAAAHYNIARAYEQLAEWDQDEASAMRAVEHVRHTVQLYTEDGAVLSLAFGRVHLADALVEAGDFANSRPDGRDESLALFAEARVNLAAAEPVLRKAQAKGYLERLMDIRGRLEWR